MATRSPFSEQATASLSSDIGKAGKFPLDNLNTFEKLAGIKMQQDAGAAANKTKRYTAEAKMLADWKIQLEGKNQDQSEQTRAFYENAYSQMENVLADPNHTIEDISKIIMTTTNRAASIQQAYNETYDRYTADNTSIAKSDKYVNKDKAQLALGGAFNEYDVLNPNSSFEFNTNAGNFVNGGAIVKDALAGQNNEVVNTWVNEFGLDGTAMRERFNKTKGYVLFNECIYITTNK